MAYSEKLIDHFEHPRNVGTLDKNAQDVGTGMVGAPACGDVMRLQIKVNPEGVIEDAKFKTYAAAQPLRALHSSVNGSRARRSKRPARLPTLRSPTSLRCRP